MFSRGNQVSFIRRLNALRPIQKRKNSSFGISALSSVMSMQKSCSSSFLTLPYDSFSSVSSSSSAHQLRADEVSADLHETEQRSLYFKLASAAADEGSEVDEDLDIGIDKDEIVVGSEIKVEDDDAAHDDENSTAIGEEGSHTKEVERQNKSSIALARAVSGRIEYALGQDNTPEVIRLFHKSEKEINDYSLRMETVEKIFNYLCYRAVNEESIEFGQIYKVYKRYRIMCEERGNFIDQKLLKTLVYTIGRAERKPSRDLMRNMVWDIYQHVLRQDRSYQEDILPPLLVSLANQPNDHVRALSLKIFRHIQTENIDVGAMRMNVMLENPVHNKFGTNIPKHIILQVMMEMGIRPRSPGVLVSMLESHSFNNFQDIGPITSLLEGIITLVKNPVEEERENAFYLDEGLLEELISVGAQQKVSSFVLLVWDLVELLGYSPTESMYENAVIAFCRFDKQDHHAFAAMSEMEEKGFKPSRDFIRNVSNILKMSVRRLDHTYYMLTQKTPEETNLSTSILNCLLSACAQEGLLDRSFAVFDQFEKFNLEPDEDTFAFLMESLTNEINQMRSILLIDPKSQKVVCRNPTKHYDEDMQMYLESIDEIQGMLAERNLPQNRFFLHHYIGGFVGLGKVQQAITILEKAIDNNEVVLMKTFEHFALQCAYHGDEEMTSHVLSLIIKSGYKEIPMQISDAVKNAQTIDSSDEVLE